MKTIFNSQGFPLMAISEKIFITTEVPELVQENTNNTFDVGGKTFVGWGSNNKYPDDSVKTIGHTGVLSTAIGFKARTSLGQGVIAKFFEGYDENGKELYQPCNEQAVLSYINGYKFMRYASAALRDLFKFGTCFPIFYFNNKGEIINVIARNARHCRISVDKKHLIVYPDFSEGDPSDPKRYEIIPMLNEEDPFTDLALRKESGKLKTNKPIAYPAIKNYYSNTDYYGIPDWDAAYRAGWIDVANTVPKFLRASYQNALSMMWHIRIPIAWYEEKFPMENYTDPDGIKKREQDINDFFKEFEDKMTGAEAGNKAFFSDYGYKETPAEADGWKIERLQNELDAKERLNTSAAANSEILFSMMINPSTLGAGMPGGSYAGNAGSGSDIRESYLVSVITTYIEKQQILGPILMMFYHNGIANNLRLLYKETILTTLNTGNSKEEITT